MTFVIHANLDIEATWAGVALPARVRVRLGAVATLLAALAPDGEADVEVWVPLAPSEVELARCRPIEGAAWWPPRVRSGTPPRADAAWADRASPAARAANDRRRGLELARALGTALPGARVVGSAAELDAAAVALAGPWVAKAPWTAAGRDRARGEGPPAGELRARVTRLLARHGELVVEPWCARLVDAGVCVSADGQVAPPHGLVTDARGGFGGIDTAACGLLPAEVEALTATARAVAAVVAATGYAGPLGLDAFAYQDAAGARRFHPLCEVNARLTFGAVARAWARRTGCTRLGFGPPPPGAHVVIAPTAEDATTAWLAPRR